MPPVTGSHVCFSQVFLTIQSVRITYGISSQRGMIMASSADDRDNDVDIDEKDEVWRSKLMAFEKGGSTELE